MLTPHPLLVPWSRKSRAIPLLPLWAVWQGCTLPFNFILLFRKFSYHWSILLLSWLNSMHMNLPPGFSTLYASSSTASMCVTFLMPKAIVYAVNEASLTGSFSASPWSQLICSQLKPNFLARNWPTSSMALLMSHNVTQAFRCPAAFRYFRNLNAMSPEIRVSACQNSIIAEPRNIMLCGNWVVVAQNTSLIFIGPHV